MRPPLGSTSHLGIMAMNPGGAASDFVGRFGRWAYLWSDDCFLSGKLLAEKIYKNL